MDKEAITELAWFEGIPKKLTEACLAEGFSSLQAEEFSFCIAQAIRDMPRLLDVLNDNAPHSADEIMDAVHMVLANRHSLQCAAQMLGLSPADE